MEHVSEPPFAQERYDLVGAAIEVYNDMGAGFLEEVYQECIEIELSIRGLSFVRQQPLQLKFKGRTLEKSYRPDLLVCGGVVVELKAIKSLTSNDDAQILNYLKGTDLRVGYLLNFGHPTQLEWKRFLR